MESTYEIKLLVEADDYDYREPGKTVNAFLKNIKAHCQGTQYGLEDDLEELPYGSVRIVGFQISTYQTD